MIYFRRDFPVSHCRYST